MYSEMPKENESVVNHIREKGKIGQKNGIT